MKQITYATEMQRMCCEENRKAFIETLKRDVSEIRMFGNYPGFVDVAGKQVRCFDEKGGLHVSPLAEESPKESPSWSAASTGNHQGLVVDDLTGANIAVAYDKANAPLLAAAPKLLAALDDCAGVLQSIENQLKGKSVAVTAVLEKAREAIAEAEGR